jgi:hypothetical protein
MVVSTIQEKLFGTKRTIDSVDDPDLIRQTKKAKTQNDHTLGQRQVPLSLYRFFDGPTYSKKNSEEMKSYLSNPKLKVTKEMTDHKVSLLQS